MKRFCNISASAIAALLGVRLETRKLNIVKDENCKHFLTNQIRLYILLHFYANSNNGITPVMSIKELSDKLSCHEKTIMRSFELLAKENMLSILDTPEPGYVTVQILNITKMYQRLGEGGKGYITCSIEEFEPILKIKETAKLRAVLIGLLEFTSRSFLSASKAIGYITLKIDTIKQAFPNSARPSDIRSAINGESAFMVLFDRTDTHMKKSISVKLKDEFNAKTIKQKIRIDAKRSIFSFIDKVNEIIHDVNIGIHEDGIVHIHDASALLKQGIDIFDKMDLIHPNKIPLLDIQSSVKQDCITIAQDYGIDSILDALRIYYMNYALPGTFTKNKNASLGGLIRNIVYEMFLSPSNSLK